MRAARELLVKEKMIVPVIEANSWKRIVPASIDEKLPGGLEAWDWVLAGAQVARDFTSKIIVGTSNPANASSLYPRIIDGMNRNTENFDIVPGLKTHYYLDWHAWHNIEGWKKMAAAVHNLSEIMYNAGQPMAQCFLMNESDMAEWWRGNYEMDLEELTAGLDLLPSDIEYIFQQPSLSNLERANVLNPLERCAKVNVAMSDSTRDVSRFMSFAYRPHWREENSVYYNEADQVRQMYLALMEEYGFTGYDAMLARQRYQVKLGRGTRRAVWSVKEAIDEIDTGVFADNKTSNEILFYAGEDSWLRTIKLTRKLLESRRISTLSTEN